MRAVIVTGDRHADPDGWRTRIATELQISAGYDRLVVIHGAARGIDSIADDVTGDYPSMAAIPMPARWDLYGNRAGPIRNEEMLLVLMQLRNHGYDVSVLAFHDQIAESKGTKHMANVAMKVEIDVWRCLPFADRERIAAVIA